MFYHPGWGVVFGYLFFNDAIDVWVLTGAALIIASALLLLVKSGKD